MRDVLIVFIVLVGSLAALRMPWVGILTWVWLSLMNPHRYSFGFAYDAPLAAMAAATTVIGLFVDQEKASPVSSASGRVLVLFTIWVTLSWLFGLDREGDYEQWKKVMKVFFMVFVSLSLFVTRRQILALAWVTTISLALLGVKGGIFTVLTGGSERVWGPPGTFIEDNNEFALALIMTVPLVSFVRSQCSARLMKLVMTAVMVLCAAAALGSYSRGALLASGAMLLLLWWRGDHKVRNAVLLSTVAVLLVAFMPDNWSQRMSTIETYDQDASALGRLSAWWTAFGIAKDYPFGVGFEIARPELVAKYSPYPERVHAAHSIYFLVLGNHGFVGLLLFLLLGATTWRAASRIRSATESVPEARWCWNLAGMCQVSMAAFAVGGAFLSLSYFDLPYYVMAVVVVTERWVQAKGWQTEVEPAATGRQRIDRLRASLGLG